MISFAKFLAPIFCAFIVAGISQAQDYDGEAETSIGGLGGLGSLSSLSALANGVLPVVSGTELQTEVDGEGLASESGDKNSEASDADSADYDDSDSNDSAASEEHPILSKFFNLLNGVRHKRSIETVEKKPLNRVKRHYKGWVPYVKTYVKTDKKAHFKWGVKAKVGKKYGRK